MVKVVTLFLIGILVLAMFGRLRLPGRGGGPAALGRPRRCPDCGRPRIGRGPCPCKDEA